MRDRARVAVVALAVLFTILYSLYGLFRHWHFGSSAYDLGIFDQVVWRLSRFETPGSSIRGFTHFLGDHFFPIVALFAPLYWIAPGQSVPVFLGLYQKSKGEFVLGPYAVTITRRPH